MSTNEYGTIWLTAANQLLPLDLRMHRGSQSLAIMARVDMAMPFHDKGINFMRPCSS